MVKEQMSTTVETCRDMLKTEEAIFFIKDFFGKKLAANLNLVNVSAPIAVLDGTGINDDLNGVEKPVSFSVKGVKDQNAVIVQSLAKWKRIRLKEYNIEAGRGLLTDMRAIRPSEELSPIHSVYVDQWDWEKAISKDKRTKEYLKETVELIIKALKETYQVLNKKYGLVNKSLEADLCFISSNELYNKYPKLSPKERENAICKEKKLVFLSQIGKILDNGETHDLRAPDYDDWTTPGEKGLPGLNGDILLWNPILEMPLEISSMGIRVDKEALLRQLELENKTDRLELYFHKRLIEDSLPLSIGGGIGQSRLCMFFLRKAHIGEIQASIWPDDMRKACDEAGIFLI